MHNPVVSQQTTIAARTVRQYYLDWLRVIAILGVFFFHILLVFNEIPFGIKNAELSSGLTTFAAFFFPWGMPLVFLIAGAGSWFALQRRPPRQYVRERFSRLLIPFVVGSILLSPISYYFAWVHQTETSVISGTFLAFVNTLSWSPNPRFFTAVGYHLWFLAFLFCYSLLTLPFFRWLKADRGQQFVSHLARLCDRPGGTLLFLLPLLLIRLSLQSLFPLYLSWTDFVSFLAFFILGYLLFADKRFMQALCRDWSVSLTVGIIAFLGAAAISIATDEFDLELVPRTPLDWAWWTCFTTCSWCWIAFMLFVGARFLNFGSKWLRYSHEAVLPFYMFHYPVIIVIAYFVVQWDADILLKVAVLVPASFIVTVGIYELLVKRINPVRAVFGMKPRWLDPTYSAKTGF
jgi:glucan biosynthesis protein C